MLCLRSACALQAEHSSFTGFRDPELKKDVVVIMLDLLAALPPPNPKHNIDLNEGDAYYAMSCLYSEHRADILAVRDLESWIS